jgi:hypothetical protein
MDAFILSNIVKFVMYRDYRRIQEALTGWIPEEDVKNILAVDLEKVDPVNMHDVIMYTEDEGFDGIHEDNEIFKMLVRRKIYHVWPCDIWGKRCTEIMDKHVNDSPMSWFLVSPWHDKLRGMIINADELIPLKYIPYVGNVLDIKKYRGRFTATEIIQSYITAHVVIEGFLSKIDDEMIPAITKAIRSGLWKCRISDNDIRRLILANPDEMFDELHFWTFDEYPIPMTPLSSYILAHMVDVIPEVSNEIFEIIHSAPTELVMHAYRLSIQRHRQA